MFALNPEAFVLACLRGVLLADLQVRSVPPHEGSNGVTQAGKGQFSCLNDSHEACGAVSFSIDGGMSSQVLVELSEN
jgi:hypothetical protein